jgi:hypothetical protein
LGSLESRVDAGQKSLFVVPRERDTPGRQDALQLGGGLRGQCRLGARRRLVRRRAQPGREEPDGERQLDRQRDRRRPYQPLRWPPALLRSGQDGRTAPITPPPARSIGARRTTSPACGACTTNPSPA